jgi:prepilin-type N-terminal cleavage/methylation domain-containing protein
MRRVYIVDGKLQWTIVGYTFAISILTTICHHTISRLLEFDQMRSLNGMGEMWSGPRMITFGVIVVLYVCIFVVAILFSNRLAGPLYRLRRHMDGVASGKRAAPVHFRKDDYYSELNGTYNKLIESLPADRKQNSEKGFSILELLTVLVIMSVLMLGGTAMFTNVTQQSLLFNQDVNKMQGILMTARNAAMTKNECSVVNVIGGNTVQVQTFPVGAPCAGPFAGADFQTSQTFNVGTTVSNFSNGVPLIFKPGGGTIFNSPVTISIASGNFNNLFTVYPAIGQVRHL